jgi:predicted nucleic acid-binding protein
MILVDSSVWIAFFNGVENKQTDTLYSTLGHRHVAIGDIILTEVLQGFRADKDYKTARSLFEDLTVLDLVGKDIAVKSADNYRALRKKGITIRKPIDVIIATFCIERNLPLLFLDRNFKPFLNNLGLVEA